MQKNVQFAQKALIIKETKGKKYMLLLKYKAAPKNSEKVIGKYGCPGGRLDFGETPDEAMKRECMEEAGVEVEPGDIVGLKTWFVEIPEKDMHNQIIAAFRICRYLGGKTTGYVSDEAKIEKSEWVHIDKFDFGNNCIKDDLEIIKKALEKIQNE